MGIPKRAIDRIAGQLKRYQNIILGAKNRDISESDTVVIVTDLLADMLGYDKYTEITTEFAIRSTYVDLAVKLGDEVRFLIEAKAIGCPLKDNHVKQAIDYAANQGIEWVILTNGWNWQVFKVQFSQPIDKTKVFDLDLLQMTPRSDPLIECFGHLSREGFHLSSMAAMFQQRQATSKYSIACVLQGDAVVSAVRRELRRIFPGLKVEEEEIATEIRERVLKREVVDSDEAKQAAASLKKAARSAERAKTQGDGAKSEAKKVTDIASPAPLPSNVEAPSATDVPA
jgi:hypothetical protein